MPAGHEMHSKSPRDLWPGSGTVEGWQLQQAASVTAVLTDPGFGVAPGPHEKVLQDGFKNARL